LGFTQEEVSEKIEKARKRASSLAISEARAANKDLKAEKENILKQTSKLAAAIISEQKDVRGRAAALTSVFNGSVIAVGKLTTELRKIKNDLLNVDTTILTSKNYYHKWISEHKQHILPNKKKFEKNSIYYDLKCFPMDYLPSFIYIMKNVENEEESVNNVFPLRSEITPKYIRLDTTTLVNLLLRKEQGNKAFYKTEGNLKKNEDKLWKFFFRTERKCFFKAGYSFHHMISTDGVGISILFLQKELVGKKLPMMKKKVAKEFSID
jgi:uncharacterized protein YpuA (DUF1002 family)